MKNRILTNWTYRRALYLIIGVAIIVQAVLSQQWFGLAFGAYFASMGLFAFGCAAGNCISNNYETESKHATSSNIQEIEFEEVRSK